MAYLKDTEHEELTIKTFDGGKSWDCCISPDYDSKNSTDDNYVYTGISISVSIPEYLTDGQDEYTSCGLLVADLSEMVDEYLNDVISSDGGASLEIFASSLRSYADKADKMAKEIAERKTNE